MFQQKVIGNVVKFYVHIRPILSCRVTYMAAYIAIHTMYLASCIRGQQNCVRVTNSVGNCSVLGGTVHY